MSHPHDQVVGNDQSNTPALLGDLDTNNKKAAAPLPKQAPTSSVGVLKTFVADTTSVVAPLRGDVDHSFAGANRIISSAAEYIAGRMPGVQTALERDPGDVGQVTDLLQKLDAQLQILFVVARRHKVSLQSAHLDAVFDGEDRIRQAGGENPRYRANTYYDDAAIAGATPNTQTQDPNAGMLNSGEQTADKPQNRQQLIAQIQSFGYMVANAMHSGLQTARDVISEPAAPKAPEMLEVLADAALDFAITAATGAVGTLIKNMMKMPKVHVGGKEGGGEEGDGAEEENLGHAMIDTLADSVKDAAKGAIKPTTKVVGAPKEEEGKEGNEHEPDKKLSVKTMYFQVAENKTRSHMDATVANYSAAATGKLLRMPVSALQALSATFTEDLKTGIKDEMTSRLVDGWVVYGKNSGQYAGDPSKRPSGSALDAPYGICEVSLTANGPSAEHITFRDAYLAYQTDAVLANIQQQKGSLADLPIARSVQVFGLGFEKFYVDEKGKIDESATKSMSADELVNYANLAHAGDRGNLEAAALAGMYKVLQALHSIPRSRITEGLR